MPGEPIEMPSDTVMVLNSTALPPAASTPAAASRASWSMCMLQGVTLAQVDAMPTCGLLKSASVKPTARSMARAGAFFSPSTTRLECLRGSALRSAGHVGQVPVLEYFIRVKPIAPARVRAIGSSSA